MCLECQIVQATYKLINKYIKFTLKMKKHQMPEFGSLTDFRAIDKHFNKMRTQSRKQLLSQLLKKNNFNTQNLQNNQNTAKSPSHSLIMKSPKLQQQRLMIQTSQKYQQQLMQTFVFLLQTFQYNLNHDIVKRIMEVFTLKNSDLQKIQIEKEKIEYIKQKILSRIQQTFKVQPNQLAKYQQQLSNDQSEVATKLKGINNSQQSINISPQKLHNKYPIYHDNSQIKNAFQWVGVKSKFPHLHPIFDQILLEKVRMFDSQLSEITKLYDGNKYDTEELFQAGKSSLCEQMGNSGGFTKSTRIISNTHRLLTKNSTIYSTQSLQKTTRSKTINFRKNKMQSEVQKKGFCDIKIRDKSLFSLKKWSKQNQIDYQQKKRVLKNNFGKSKQIPIIFEFVKKYTSTIRARDNIYKKWQNRQRDGITAEQLRYLCSTSLFLNKTLTKSQQARIRKNIGSAGRNLLSKLQFNIAQKIIETYKTFTKKVADLRANYYQNLTQKRKKQYSITCRNRKMAQKHNKSKVQIQKMTQMFRTICKGQRMKMRTNFKVIRWVKLFVEKLKMAVQCRRQQQNNPKKIKKLNNLHNQSRIAVDSNTFSKLAYSKTISSSLFGYKSKYPSSKIIKRQDHSHYRNLSIMKAVPSSQRFFYEKSFENKIKTLNSARLKDERSFRSHLSGGPSQLGRDLITVDLRKKQIYYTSERALISLIKIQAFWKKEYQKKLFADVLSTYRAQMEEDFKIKQASLFRIYPRGRKIQFKSIKARLKRVTMRTLNVFKPYERQAKKPINNYTSFCAASLSLNEMKIKNAKNSARRIAQFCTMVENNLYSKIKQSGFVITKKQINDPICSEGASVMWWSVKNSNVQLTRKFLEGGGNPNAVNFEGDSCLHVALQNGDLQICFLLLDFGADLNLKNKNKVTPLFFATPKMLKFLGIEDGTVSGNQTTRDNNSLYFNPQTITEFYPDHMY